MERRDEHLADELAAAAAEMIPGVGPFAAVFTRRTMVKMREERERRVSIALGAAERLSGLDREELGDAIAEDPRLVPLLTRILYAAGMNGYDRTLSAMGRALGDAVRDRERIDEVDLILTALADLGAGHVRLLQALAVHGAWVWPYSFEHPDLPARVRDRCLATLISRGLVTASTGPAYRVRYDLSELGRTLLDVLAELETDDD
jgi:hypothetical protein